MANVFLQKHRDFNQYPPDPKTLTRVTCRNNKGNSASLGTLPSKLNSTFRSKFLGLQFVCEVLYDAFPLLYHQLPSRFGGLLN
jgi:hypothetical protein